MMTVMAEFQIRHNLAMSTEGCHTFGRYSIPDINAFVRTRCGQIPSRCIDIDFDQVTRIVIHRAFTRANSFAILRVVNSAKKDLKNIASKDLPLTLSFDLDKLC